MNREGEYYTSMDGGNYRCKEKIVKKSAWKREAREVTWTKAFSQISHYE